MSREVEKGKPLEMPNQLIRSFFVWAWGALWIAGNLPAQDDVGAPGFVPAGFRPVPDAPEILAAEDLHVDLLLTEPRVANPLYITFDERGRMWLVQYRQYPWPAGLRLLSRDNVWRNVYDPPFAPPPPHAEDSPFRGADLVTIHEDTTGDGRFDKQKTFLEGLNFATAALPGRGGVFVMNPPYLLFYPDADRDDVPDTEQPEILLSGFGIEDSHSIANSLRWGPDGWIYATQGSTVSGSVVVHSPDGQQTSPVHSMGQNVWRYHPETRKYEIFGEGGGNSFGVEIDSKGRVFSGHNGGNTRGFHYVQGGYSQKTFGKHGELSNPYAFDYYRPMAHHDVRRFTHTFSIYESNELPERYRGRLIGVNPVEHHLVLSEIGPDGASRKTRDLALVMKAGEGERSHWFTPVDIQVGPDGALYVADWYSVQPNHYKNHEGETNPDLGRIYRLRSAEYQAPKRFDLATLDSSQLIDQYLDHPKRWFRMMTLRILGDRRDETVVTTLRQRLTSQRGDSALHALWALHLSGGLDPATAVAALRHSNAHVRRWTVLLLGDDVAMLSAMADELVQLAGRETDVESRCQLAATARRMSAKHGLRVLFQLLGHPDHDDVFVPNMIWWGIEKHCDDPELILDFAEPSIVWKNEYRVGEFTMTQNLMKRFALAGRQDDLKVCARLLGIAPDDTERKRLVEAFLASFEGRTLPNLPQTLTKELAAVEGPFADLLAVRRGDLNATERALGVVASTEQAASQRLALMRAVSDVRSLPEPTIAVLKKLLAPDEPAEIVRAALLSLQKFNSADVGQAVLEAYPLLEPETQDVARQVLASRAEWSKQWLRAIDNNRFPKNSVDDTEVDRMYRHVDQDLQQALAKQFPRQVTTKEMFEARINDVESIVRQGQGTPLDGQQLFHGKANCGKCHRLFHRGSDIGPDLTAYNRTNLRRMLLAIIHPNAEIREGFESHTAYTIDGRVLTGVKQEQNDQVLILRGADGQDQTVPVAEIDELETNKTSLMPERILATLSEEEIRDLFAFLTSTTPPK